MIIGLAWVGSLFGFGIMLSGGMIHQNQYIFAGAILLAAGIGSLAYVYHRPKPMAVRIKARR